MQTLMLQVDDSIADKAIAYLKEFVKNEKNAKFEIKADPLKEELQKRIEDIDSGKTILTQFDSSYSKEIDSFIDNL